MTTPPSHDPLTVERRLHEEGKAKMASLSPTNLLKLSIRSRHDPAARMELVQNSQAYSFATSPDNGDEANTVHASRRFDRPRSRGARRKAEDDRKRSESPSSGSSADPKRARSARRRHQDPAEVHGAGSRRSPRQQHRTHGSKHRSKTNEEPRRQSLLRRVDDSTSLDSRVALPQGLSTAVGAHSSHGGFLPSPSSALRNHTVSYNLQANGQPLSPEATQSRRAGDAERGSEKRASRPKPTGNEDQSLEQRVESACTTYHDHWANGNSDGVKAAAGNLREVVNRLKEHAARRPTTSSSPTGPTRGVSGPPSKHAPHVPTHLRSADDRDYEEVAMLVSFAVSTRKVCKKSPNRVAAKATLDAVVSAGGLPVLADALASDMVQPETAGGRAAIAVLSEASAHEDLRPEVSRIFNTQPSSMVRVCGDVMNDKSHPAEMRNDTAHLVLNAAKDEDTKARMLRENPKLLDLANETLKETQPLMATMAVHRRVRKPKPIPVEPIKASIDEASPPNVILSSVSMANLAALGDDGPGSPTELPEGATEQWSPEEVASFLEKIDALKRMETGHDNEDTSQKARNVADLLCRSVRIAKTKNFTDADGHGLLLDLMKRCKHDPLVFGIILDAFAKGADVDPLIRDFCLEKVTGEADPKLAASDQKAAEAYMALMTDVLLRPRKRTAAGGDDTAVPQLKKQLDIFLTAWEEVRHRDYPQVESAMKWLREIVSDDTTGVALKMIFEKLVSRQASGQSMILDEDRALRRLFDFVYETMQAYCRSPIDSVESFVGEEVMYGCLCFQLLAEQEKNGRYLIQSKVPDLLLDSMERQPNCQVAQHMVLTSIELCTRNKDMPTAFTAVPSAAHIAAEVVRRGIVETEGCEPLYVEDLMRPRLELVQHMAYNRQIFSKTSIMESLIQLWNDSDEYYYGHVRHRSPEEIRKFFKSAKRADKVEAIGTALKKGLGKKEAADPSSHHEEETASPLKRRASTVGPGGASLARRKSAVGPVPAGRRQSTADGAAPMKGGLSVSRKISSATKKEDPVSVMSTETDHSLKRRASMMQRHASVAAGGDLHRNRSLASFASHLSSFNGSSEDDDDWPSLIEDSGPVMLPHILKTMRKVVCGASVVAIKSEDVPTRLVGLVVDRETNPAILADVLFMIGALAAVPDLKDSFGEIDAIERILDLLRRAYKHDGLHVSEVVGNSCLALANLCVVHVHNTRRFNKYKGSELIVDVLRKRGAFNDAKGVNGASALVCNLCFKNEDMKKSLGNKGAPEALVEAMRSYRSSGGEVGSRCMSSMFKAIGNLALNAHNMVCFMAADIPSAYADFLEEADNELDDSTLEACFRTLANLVIEKDNMEKFSSSVVPVLSIIRKIDKSSSPNLYRWAFETIGNLCRWPESAKEFTMNEGIQTILSVLPYLEDSANLHSSAIFVLGIQTSDKDNIPILINAGILNFTKQILDNYCQQIKEYETAGGDFHSTSPPKPGLTPPTAQLAVAAIRCTRRVLAAKEHVDMCLESGCFKSVLDTYHASWSKSMLSYEALRVVFTMIAFNSEQHIEEHVVAKKQSMKFGTRASMGFQSRATRVTQAAAAMRMGTMMPQQGTENTPFASSKTTFNIYGDEDEPRTRVPLGPRAWESMNLSDQDIDALIATTRRTLADERVSRNLRLFRIGVGLLAYFACEKKGFDGLYERLEFDDDAPTAAPIQKWDKQRRKSLVTPAVEPKPDDSAAKGMKRRKSIIGFFKGTPEKQGGDGDVFFGTQRPPDKTSVLDLLFHGLDAFTLDRLVVEESCILLNHMLLCAVTGEQLEAVADRTFYKEFKALAYKDDFLLNAAKESLKLYAVVLDKGHEATAEEMQSYYQLVDLEFPLELSGWNDDPFPDGVQSLPPEVKQFLRDGGKLEIYTLPNDPDPKAKPEKQDFLWKSTHDMLQLQWKVCNAKDKLDPDPKYPFSLPISLVSGIIPGVSSAAFAEIVKRASLSESCCVGLMGPKTADFPDRVALYLKAKSQKERDTLVHVFTVWRDAAAYGFR